eukprot:scaffold25316_cov145-Skeletonema_marinoi.AAC.3
MAIPTCEVIRSTCQKNIVVNVNVKGLGNRTTLLRDHPHPVDVIKDGAINTTCKEAESCSCEGANDDFKEVVFAHADYNYSETHGLYNECKCDFWWHLCEDTGVGEACDYAAEYCCGDYGYWESIGKFDYLNSPACYCDFFNYAQNELGHSLKPKALNTSIYKVFKNPCGQSWSSSGEDERSSLEAIYEGTNGQSWTNNAGWMDDTVAHCQWHGISCDVDGHVTSIDLRDNNLAGQFPVYTRNTNRWGGSQTFWPDVRVRGSPARNTNPNWNAPAAENDWKDTKYGLANLYSLKTLNLANNKLTGTIESRPLYNLASLTHYAL